MRLFYSIYLTALANSAVSDPVETNATAVHKIDVSHIMQAEDVPTTVPNALSMDPEVEYCRSFTTGRKIPRRGLLRFILPGKNEQFVVCAKPGDILEIVELD